MALEILLLILAIPVGYLIAWMARDELVFGRKWFILLIFLSFLGAILSFFFKKSYLVYTFAFISIVCFISLIKSYDKKWVKKRI